MVRAVISALRRGRLALAGAGLSVVIMTAVAAAGPSAAEPYSGRASLLPPWFWPMHLSDTVVIVALWAALAIGTASIFLGLSAVRAGWRPSPRRLLAAGALGVGLLVVVPPVGSTDLMDYATYGRITTLGHSPYSMSPLSLRETGDPVAALSSRPWRKYRSVYGPVATAEQWAASEIGRSSAARTTVVLKLVNALAFLAVALILEQLVSRQGRVRAHLLWTVNPLMLWGVVGGGHIDGLAMALAMGGLWVLRSLMGLVRDPSAERRPLLTGFVGGLLLGAAAAVKAPFALVAAAPAWSLRRSPKVLAAAAAGGFLALVPGYLVIARPAYEALKRRSGHMSELSMWHLAKNPLHHPITPSNMVVAALTLALVAIFLRGLPSGGPETAGARVALALCLAWIIPSAIYFPWYEVMVLPLLALLPASRADLILLARAGIAAIGSAPGMARFFTPHWVNIAVTQVVAIGAPALLLLLSLLLVVASLWRSWGLGVEADPTPVRTSVPVP